MDSKSFHLELKEANEASGEFSGTITIYGVEDLGADIVERGALDATLKARPEVPILWQHDTGEVIGKGRLQDEGDKVTIRGKLDMGDPTAVKILHKLKAGLVSRLSIGFQAVKVTWEETKDRMIRHIQELALWEVSICLFPMLSAAQVTSVKSQTIRDYERFLHASGWSKSESCKLASRGWPGLAAADPAAGDEEQLSTWLRAGNARAA